MFRTRSKVRGAAFILWHARHEFYHVLLGLIWAWYLREQWNTYNGRWILLSVAGSLLPDIEHFLYFFTYGRKDTYTREIFSLLRDKSWRKLAAFIESGHKSNTNLVYHNYYFMGILLALALASSFLTWRAGVILFGAMIIHYLFDIIDDIITLGYINSNWRRWGRTKIG